MTMRIAWFRKRDACQSWDEARCFDQWGWDLVRTARLKELGFTVIRFENKIVFQDTEGVLREIVANFKK